MQYVDDGATSQRMGELYQVSREKYLGEVEAATTAIESLALTKLDKLLAEQRQLQRVFFSLL